MTVTGIVTLSDVPPRAADPLKTARELLAQVARHEAAHEWEQAIEFDARWKWQMGTSHWRARSSTGGRSAGGCKDFFPRKAPIWNGWRISRGRGIGRPRPQRTCAGRGPGAAEQAV